MVKNGSAKFKFKNRKLTREKERTQIDTDAQISVSSHLALNRSVAFCMYLHAVLIEMRKREAHTGIRNAEILTVRVVRNTAIIQIGQCVCKDLQLK